NGAPVREGRVRLAEADRHRRRRRLLAAPRAPRGGQGARPPAGRRRRPRGGRQPPAAPRHLDVSLQVRETVTIIGGGLAGCEAAWQLARRGIPVDLFEMRPVRGTEAHTTDHLAELVCSNSFRNATLETAVGLLKEEMRRLGSLVMRVADATPGPGRARLAVAPSGFAQGVPPALPNAPPCRPPP